MQNKRDGRCRNFAMELRMSTLVSSSTKISGYHLDSHSLASIG